MKARICNRCGGKVLDTGTRIIECWHCGTTFEVYEGPEVPIEASVPRHQSMGDYSSQVAVYSSSSYCGTAVSCPGMRLYDG